MRIIKAFIFILMLGWLMPAAMNAQSLNGSVTNTEDTTYSQDINDPDTLWPINTIYSNWRWTDGNGVVRYFNGTTRTKYSYIYYPDGSRKMAGWSSTSLTNVQATDGSSYYLTAKGDTGYVNGTGNLFPKYQVLSVIYAAPGSGSRVDYTSTSVAGNSTNVSSSFANGMQFSATVGGSLFIGGGTSTYSAGWTTTKTSSNTLSVSKTVGYGITSNGQTNPPYGVDHDFDQVIICLNPALSFVASTSAAIANVPQWTIGCDTRDPNAGGGPDIVSLTVAELKNPSLITNTDLLDRLNRSWAGFGQGLTISDYQTILGRNPFANDGTNGSRPAFNSLASNNRFRQVGSIYYAPLAPGQGPQITSGWLIYSSSESTTSSAQDTYSVSTSTQGDVDFFVKIHINNSSNYTWTNTTSQTVSSGTTQQLNYVVPRPAPTWTGPSEILVWQDMVYGTFFFSY